MTENIKDITLRALANFSPGFALKPLGQRVPLIKRNPEGVAGGAMAERRRQPLQGCVFIQLIVLSQGCSNPGNRRVYYFETQL
jgi:hypothetical protein